MLLLHAARVLTLHGVMQMQLDTWVWGVGGM